MSSCMRRGRSRAASTNTASPPTSSSTISRGVRSSSSSRSAASRIEHGRALGRDLTLAELRAGFRCGIPRCRPRRRTRRLGIEGEDLSGVRDAVDFIAELRQAANPAAVAVGRRVVVIGGGNTAIDAATQARRLGAEDVTIVYRRGREQMSATPKEQDWAQINGVPHPPLGSAGAHHRPQRRRHRCGIHPHR